MEIISGTSLGLRRGKPFSGFTVLALMALLLRGGSIVLGAGQTPKEESVTINVCELSSLKPVTYKLTTGPWLSKAGGAVAASLPLEIRAGESPCWIRLEKQAVLQALPGSALELRREGKMLRLTVGKGRVYFGLYRGVALKVATSAGTVVAEAGGALPAAKDAAEFASLGLVRTLPGTTPALEIVNIQGQARLIRPEGGPETINPGQKARYDGGTAVVVAQNAEPATRPVPVSEVTARAEVPAAATAPETTVAPAASATPLSAAEVGKILRTVLPGAINDNLNSIAQPVHTQASPYIPPPRNRGPVTP